MDQTPNLALPYILAAQAQKHITHNEALRALDAVVHLMVLDRDLTSPPGSPANGDRYIVAASATGAWAGRDLDIAAYQDGAWALYEPREGWIAWIADENAAVVYDGSAWSAFGGGGGGGGISLNPATGGLVGVNATADTTNRISVSSPAALFNHEGAGHQIKVNKAAAADTASLLFQTAFSGRAEMGTTGDDNFHFKVSPDGSAWTEAIGIDKTTGIVTMAQGLAGGGRLKSMQVFTSSGTWTKPSGIRSALVFCVGGGGGGGGGSGAASYYAVGGGGGGGGAAIELIDVSGTGSEIVTIGAGGTGGSTSGGNGGAGGTSSFGSFCSATGGAGGTGQTASNSQAMTQGGAGGAGSGGLLNLSGAPGTYGSREGGTIGMSGNGGASLFGGGGLGLNGSSNGNPGTSPGSGGGACSTNSATARSGGAGADGIVWVWEFE